jgi:hypothetical protein
MTLNPLLSVQMWNIFFFETTPILASYKGIKKHSAYLSGISSRMARSVDALQIRLIFSSALLA